MSVLLISIAVLISLGSLVFLALSIYRVRSEISALESEERNTSLTREERITETKRPHNDFASAMTRIDEQLQAYNSILLGCQRELAELSETFQLAIVPEYQEIRDETLRISNHLRSTQPIEFLDQLQKEWGELFSDIQTFWETLRQYYELNFKGKQNYPDTIMNLGDLADPPPGLPPEQEEPICEYPNRHELAGKNGLLYDFCSKVYPKRSGAPTLKGCTDIPERSFDAFHQARGKLAKFWQRWGEKVYVEDIISLDAIARVRTFDAHHRLLKILSYLEICLAQWTEDKTSGKVWLFSLTRDWPTVPYGSG